MKNIFLLILFSTVSICLCNGAATEGYCHRVKRSNSMLSTTKPTSVNTTTTAATTKKDEYGSTTSKPKRDVDDEIATQIRSAIEKLKLKSPALHVRHAKMNHTDPAALRELRRGIEKERCTDVVRHPKSLLLLNSRSAEEAYDDEHKDEKFFEFLTGKATAEPKHHHERYGRAFFVKDNSGKKAKRNAVKSTIHHKLHKDVKEHKHKRSDGSESPIDNFMRLTKMLVDLSGNMRPEVLSHHAGDADSLTPIAGERLTEVIYKPMTIESSNGGDDVALISSNEYLSNDNQPQHAVLPLEGGAGFHEYTLPLVSNFAPLKLITNAVESGALSDKDDSDNDEYEMTCPVHFKRNADGSVARDANGGVLEVCTCHLYRKKKQVI